MSREHGNIILKNLLFQKSGQRRMVGQAAGVRVRLVQPFSGWLELEGSPLGGSIHHQDIQWWLERVA